MSASREKKKRQEYLAANGGVDPKAARKVEREKAEKRSKILYRSVAIAFFVVAAALLIKNFVLDATFMQRGRTALTIDGEKYTVADVSYFYKNAYQYEMTNGYGSYFIDPTQPLSAQNYIFDNTKTWADYFKEQTVSTMKLVHAAITAAEAAGMTLDEEHRTTLEDQIAAMKAQAEQNGTSYKKYLLDTFGPYMTPSVYEENLERTLLASQYTQNHYDSLTFTDEEIEKYYLENKNTYDIVDGAYVTISGKPETKKDADGKEITPTDEEVAKALTDAKDNADRILADYDNGAGYTLESLAKEVTGATYTGGTDLTYTSGFAMDWLFDEARVAGDCEVIFDKENSTYYVVAFNGRQRESAPSYNVRHILITGASLNLPEGQTATDAEILAAAMNIMAEWEASEKTEASFAALAEKYTQDGGSKTTGGLYEDVLKGNMVSQFEDWCYAEDRKAGDVGIVETDYGQHIMFFVGYGEDAYWYTACQTALADAAYNEWQTALVANVVAEFKGPMDLIA